MLNCSIFAYEINYTIFYMKTKTSILLVALSLLSLTAFSQTKKGNWTVSGTSTIQVMNISPESGDGNTIVLLTPSLSYFVADGFAVGIDLNLLSVENLTILSALPTASYYFNTKSQVKPFVQLGVGYGNVKVGETSTGGLTLSGAGGITYLINNKVGLNLGLRYMRSDFDGNAMNVFGGMGGISVFF